MNALSVCLSVCLSLSLSPSLPPLPASSFFPHLNPQPPSLSGSVHILFVPFLKLHHEVYPPVTNSSARGYFDRFLSFFLSFFLSLFF